MQQERSADSHIFYPRRNGSDHWNGTRAAGSTVDTQKAILDSDRLEAIYWASKFVERFAALCFFVVFGWHEYDPLHADLRMASDKGGQDEAANAVRSILESTNASDLKDLEYAVGKLMDAARILMESHGQRTTADIIDNALDGWQVCQLFLEKGPYWGNAGSSHAGSDAWRSSWA